MASANLLQDLCIWLCRIYSFREPDLSTTDKLLHLFVAVSGQSHLFDNIHVISSKVALSNPWLYILNNLHSTQGSNMFLDSSIRTFNKIFVIWLISLNALCSSTPDFLKSVMVMNICLPSIYS